MINGNATNPNTVHFLLHGFPGKQSKTENRADGSDSYTNSQNTKL
jgi:hypothetical protein